MAKDHGPSVKDDDQYEKLRQKGESKEKAARIANTGRSAAGKRGGKAGRYEAWSKKDLQARAKEIRFEGRSKMNKGELIDALPQHSRTTRHFNSPTHGGTSHHPTHKT